MSKNAGFGNIYTCDFCGVGGLSLHEDAKEHLEDGRDRCFECLLKQRDELKVKLADWEDSVERVMAEECADDEIHCTCVPALRAKLEAAEKQNAFLKMELTTTEEWCETFDNARHDAEAKLEQVQKWAESPATRSSIGPMWAAGTAAAKVVVLNILNAEAVVEEGEEGEEESGE